MAPKRRYKEYILNESSQPSKANKYRRIAQEKEVFELHVNFIINDSRDCRGMILEKDS